MNIALPSGSGNNKGGLSQEPDSILHDIRAVLEVNSPNWKKRESWVKAEKNAIVFEAYYTGMPCPDYRYAFTQKDRTLIVKHENVGPCTKSIERFGVKGVLTGVKEGEYIFALQRYSVNDTNPRQIIFSKHITVE